MITNQAPGVQRRWSAAAAGTCAVCAATCQSCSQLRTGTLPLPLVPRTQPPRFSSTFAAEPDAAPPLPHRSTVGAPLETPKPTPRTQLSAALPPPPGPRPQPHPAPEVASLLSTVRHKMGQVAEAMDALDVDCDPDTLQKFSGWISLARELSQLHGQLLEQGGCRET